MWKMAGGFQRNRCFLESERKLTAFIPGVGPEKAFFLLIAARSPKRQAAAIGASPAAKVALSIMAISP